MIIGIDGNEANVEKRVGISEYAFELIRQFEKFRIQNLEFRIYLKDEPSKDLPKVRAGWKYRVIGPKKLWTQLALPLDLFIHKARPDVFFSPTHYAPRFSLVPTAISIMDISYMRFPRMFKIIDLYQLKHWTRYSVRNASRIFTISQTSKDDIIKIYQVPGDKVVVTYPGIKMDSSKFKVQSSKFLQDKYGIDGDYILFVGTLQPRKNIKRLIKAFSEIIKEREEKPQLVIIGKKGWLYEEILQAPEAYGVEEKVLFLDFISDEDLPLFYKHALFLILPSLYEGFGLPIPEAMQYGCPVITSNVSSLPEAGGEAALYVDPESVDDIAKKMAMLLDDKKLRKDLVDKGYKQVKKFSWEKTAKQTLKVLTEVASDAR